MAHTQESVVIVGAGIIGAACAWEIARIGQPVTVLESETVASGTSCRAMGHLGVYDESDAQLALSAFARVCWDSVAPDLPAPVEYVRRGSLWVATDEAELAEAERRRVRLKARGLDGDVLDAAALYAAEPNLRPGLSGGLRVPGDAVIDPTEATRYFVERAIATGATVRTRAPVANLVDGGVVLRDGSHVRADRVVVATGWQTPALLPGLPVRPRKGHIALTAPRPGFVQHNLSEIGYMAETRPTAGDSISLVVQPRASGRYLFGATRQFAGPSTDVDPSVIEALRRTIYAFVPGLADLALERTWAGLRPAGPDSVPLIGPWPEHPSWVLATGHEGIGITTSLATGRLVAEIVAGLSPSVPLEPYDPARVRAAAASGPGGPR